MPGVRDSRSQPPGPVKVRFLIDMMATTVVNCVELAHSQCCVPVDPPLIHCV